MACPRCGKDNPTKSPWCPTCELDYDTWIRQHATDIIWQVMSGALVLMCFAVVLPMLGAGAVISAGGVFVGFGTILAANRLNRRRRRKQFIAGAALPRAYLADPK